MDEADVREAVDKLRLIAADDFSLHMKSVKTTRETLAKVYLNWRELSKVPELLDAEYKRCGIKTRNRTSNDINFRAFIKLAYDFIHPTKYQSNIIGEYNIVLNEIDKNYNENTGMYKTNAVGKIASFIEQKGGVSGIVKENYGFNADNDADNDADADDKSLKKKKIKDDELARRSIDILSNSETGGIGNTKPRYHVRADENNLVVMIGRREKNGTITLLGSTNEKQAIEATAIHATKRNVALIPYTLRLITEIIHTQLFPRIGMPATSVQIRAWKNRILLDKTGMRYSRIAKKKKGEYNEKTDNMLNPRSLQLRGEQQDILFSALRDKRSVVTKCIPKIFIGDANKRIYLKTEQRNRFEDYLADNEVELFNAVPHNCLQAAQNQKYDYKLTVKSKILNYQRDFHFYEYGRTADKAKMKMQTDFDFASFVPEWSAVVDLVWFEELRAQWLDEWFTKLGKNTQIARENNYTFDIAIGKKEIAFVYNMDTTGIAPFHSQCASIKWLTAQAEYRYTHRSKDLAPVLYNIADIAVDGKVTISGNADATIFEFKTDIADYQIAVPTHIVKGSSARKNKTGFGLRD